MTLTAERPAVRSPTDPGLAARAGMALWRLFTSVNFAVVQIVVSPWRCWRSSA